MAVAMRRRELLSGAPILCLGNGWPLNRALARAASEPDGRRWASSSLVVGLTSSSQVLRSLSPAITPGFDFAPDRQAEIAAGDYALGDVDIRFRSDGMWRDISTAFRRIPVIPLPAEHGSIAAADLSPTLPAGLPFRIERRWLFDGDALVLRFTLRNLTTSPVDIGGVGFAMPFDNILTDRTLEQAHAHASFADPYVGLDGGHLQVTRLNGQA